MTVVDCPYDGCTWKSAELRDDLALETLKMHRDDRHRPTPPTPPNTTPTSTNRKTKVNYQPPSIAAAGTGEDWKYFLTRWEEYIAATGVTGEERVLALLECCDDELRKDVTRNAGKSLAQTPEDEVLRAIKLLAVRDENVMVARHELFNM